MGFFERFEHDSLIAAHRGFRAVRAENTMAAFEAAIGRCDFIELDVGFSSDGVPIIIHDDTLERTSNVAEVAGFSPPYTIVEYRYEELLQLDFSSWFIARDPFGMIATGQVNSTELEALPIQRIPTLEEALRFCKQHAMPVNVEIKDMRGTAFDTIAVSQVLSIIQSLEMEEDILLSSFNHHYIAQAKELAPHISRAALQEKEHPENLVNYLRELGTVCYHCDLKIATEGVIRELTDAGVIVNVYTVNSAEEKRRLFSYGVRSVFTDFL